MGTVNRKTGDCSLCGGVHYGSWNDIDGKGLCPYQCSACNVNFDPCEREGCPRNRRWKSEEGRVPDIPPLNTSPSEREV